MVLDNLDKIVAENTQRLMAIKERISQTCQKSGRNPQTVTLVLVTKTIPLEIINASLSHWRKTELVGKNDGEIIVGENKAQEAQQKFQYWKEHEQDNPTIRIAPHFIGHLQTNKVNKVIPYTHLIHSLDRWSLLEKLIELDPPINALLQVNVSGEESKSGWSPDELPTVFKRLEEASSDSQPTSQLNIKGLMTMAPLSTVGVPEKSRSTFTSLKEIQTTYQARIQEINLKHSTQHSLDELSMGMTNDFEVAIEEGATLIRVGSGVFGKRTY